MPNGLEQLREEFWEAVMLHESGRRKPCWFCAKGFPCGGEGPREAAHWIKRQEVERWVARLLTGAPWNSLPVDAVEAREFCNLAAWDPRNAVPAHESGHRRFDGHRVPLPKDQIVIPYEQVPLHVVEFAADWGLEHSLERKHPRGA